MADIEVADDVYIVTKETAERYLRKIEQPPDPAPEPPVVGPDSETPPEEPPEPPPEPGSDPVQAPRTLTWTGEVPTQKWMNFYTKVLTKFAADSDLKLTLRVEVAPESGVTDQSIEDTKLALRELGLSHDIEAV